MSHFQAILTREKHLDHMVKVVPLIVFAYAIQCYLLAQMGPMGFAVNGLIFLGVCLVSMITGFVVYDLTHAVNFGEEELTVSIKWLGYKKILKYTDILETHVVEPGQSFSSLNLKMMSGKKFTFYFIDEADKIKSWLDKKRIQEVYQAAA